MDHAGALVNDVHKVLGGADPTAPPSVMGGRRRAETTDSDPLLGPPV